MFANRVCFKSKGHNLIKNLTFNDIFLKNKHVNSNRILYSAINNSSTTSSTKFSRLDDNQKNYFNSFYANKKRQLTSNSLVIYASKPNQLINQSNENKLAEDPIKIRQAEIEQNRLENEINNAIKNDKLQKIILNNSPKFFERYVRLMRLDKPAPILLNYWPAAWAILGAASYQSAAMPDFYMLTLFGLGAIAMRTSGCIINDIWDRKIDSRVERTKNRPIASGEVSIASALVILGANLSLALSILLQLNLTTQVLGACCLFPVAIYPAAKRFTNWPQGFLGLTFNWGALMGWSAIMCSGLETQTQSIFTFLPALAVYFASVNWTLLYDTIYAYPDKAYDLKLGLKSTAITTQNNPKKWLLGFSTLATSNLALFGYLTNQEPIYYITVGLSAAHFLKQIILLRPNSPESCYKQFKSNNTIGALISFGLFASLLIR